MTKQKHIIISALGLDRPGIVSEISSIINKSRANITESRMIKLGGDFTMMILASTSHENATLLIKNLDKSENSQWLATYMVDEGARDCEKVIKIFKNFLLDCS